MDLFRSTLQIGTQQIPVSAYFSFGGMVFTDYAFHNTVENPQFDFSDWDHTSGDAFGPYNAGVPGTLSDIDLRVMDLLGCTRFYAPTSLGLALSTAIGLNAPVLLRAAIVAPTSNRLDQH